MSNPKSYWAAILIISSFHCASVHATEPLVPEGGFTVPLQRQQIPLYNEGGIVHHKSAYHGLINVGGPDSQSFEVVFDTGSGHLFIPSTMCRSQSCKNHRRFSKKKSETALDIDVDGSVVQPKSFRDQVTVSFGTGEVTGIFVQDNVCLTPPVNISTNSLLQVNKGSLHKDTIPEETNIGAAVQNSIEDQKSAQSAKGCLNLRFISATDMTSDPFDSFTFDGVMGLGLPSLSQTPEFNFIESAAKAGIWGSTPGKERMFSVFLAITKDEESEITFGAWKPHRILPGNELAWCDVRDVEYGYWQIDVLSISAGGTHVPYCDGGCRAVVDTGTSLLGVPSVLGVDLFDLLRYPANSTDGTCTGPGPDLEIDLGNIKVVLTPADYGRPEYMPDTTGDDPDSPPPPPGEAFCVPMLMHIDLPSPLSPKTLILGEPVLQRYYTAFDAGNPPRVGFAPAAHSAPATPSNSNVQMV